MKKSDVVIVVPIYKAEMNITEKISFQQLFRVLTDYNIVFVSPQRMKSFCDKQHYNTVFFDDRFFKSTATYSELLISEDFYSLFANYKYMLIYQLDAYVFRDELLDFCNLGYDYIGAPVPRKLGEWGTVRARVGNGGLSLRKISSVRRILGDMPKICNESGLGELFYKHEDLFFGYCGAQSNIEFSVPDIKTAMRFAVDDDVCHIFQRMNDGTVEIPFGCHGWSRKNTYPIWRKFITEEEIIQRELDEYYKDGDKPSYRVIQWYRLSEYILFRFKKYHRKRVTKLCNDFLPPNQCCFIWGYGEYGVILHKLLNELGYKVITIFDINPKSNLLDDASVIAPDLEYIKRIDCPIIVTPVHFEQQIKKQLLVHGIAGSRILTYSCLLNRIITEYVSNLAHNMIKKVV